MQNKNGFSLIEVLIALVILLLVSLALMQTALVSINSNMVIVLRDQAVAIGQERMNEARSVLYDNLVSDPDSPADLQTAECYPYFTTLVPGGTGVLHQRNARSIVNFKYCTNLEVTPLAGEQSQFRVMVAWVWKGENYNYAAYSIRSKGE